MYFTRSVWHTSYPAILGHDVRKAHGNNKPPQLMAECISFFTRPGMLVLDPLAGVGGTLLGAYLCGRRGFGIEIEQRWVDIYQCVCAREGIEPMQLTCDDYRLTLPLIRSGSIDYILTDPPYGPYKKKTMSAVGASRQNRKTDLAIAGVHAGDIGNCLTYDAFFAEMAVLFGECYRVLRSGGYMTFFMRDNVEEGEYQFMTAELSRCAKDVGFQPRGVTIWYQNGTRLRPYGMPNKYCPNFCHHNVVTLYKRRESELARAERATRKKLEKEQKIA